MHFVGPDQLHGFARRLTTDVFPAAMDWVPTQDPEGRFVRGGHARSYVPPRVGVRPWTKFLAYDEETHFRALEYLRERSLTAPDEPFFLVASYHHPHDPFQPTQELWDAYDGADDPRFRRSRTTSRRRTPRWTAGRTRRTRSTPPTCATRQPARAPPRLLRARHLRRHEARRAARRGARRHGRRLRERPRRHARRARDGAEALLLRVVGADPAARAAAGRRACGHVGRRPGLAARSRADAARPRRRAGGSAAAGRRRQLRAAARGESQPGRAVLSEYHVEKVRAPCFMARRGRWKYVLVHGHDEQLFDLEADPGEWTNLRRGAPGGRGRAARPDPRALRPGRDRARGRGERAPARARRARDGPHRDALGLRAVFDATRQYVR